MTHSEVMGVDEVADYLKMHSKTVSETWRELGIPFRRVGRKRLLIHVEDLREWLRARPLA